MQVLDCESKLPVNLTGATKSNLNLVSPAGVPQTITATVSDALAGELSFTHAGELNEAGEWHGEADVTVPAYDGPTEPFVIRVTASLPTA